MDTSGTHVECTCCGRTLARRKVHQLGEAPHQSYICRRCGLWVAIRRRPDAGEH